jgi:hypothetical protein
MSRNPIALYCSIIIILLFLPLLASNTAAAGADAELHNVDVTASPWSQGVGGEIIVDAAVYIFGGCCYHLYAFEVTANIFVPEGVNVVSGPTPKEYEEVDAQPGGVATIVHFKWTVTGNTQGLFNLAVTVSSKNCGSVESSVAIVIVAGCSISPPEIYPEEPSVDRDTIISVTAQHPLEGRNVESVTLFHISDGDVGEGTATNNTIIMPDGREISGTAVDMEQDTFKGDQWTGKIESNNRGKLYYWFVANDNLGDNTTSSIYEMEVIDQGAIDIAVGGLFWGLVVGTIIGCLVILVIQDKYLKKKESEIGVLNEAREIVKESRGSKRQVALTLSLLVISVVIVIAGFISGMFSEIVDLVLG